jgi:mRNA interferase RelE/StbE
MYTIEIRPAANRALRKLPADIAARVWHRLAELENDPRPPDCKKLKGPLDLWRIRVGAYRVVYQIEDWRLVVVVVDVAHRKDIYRGL